MHENETLKKLFALSLLSMMISGGAPVMASDGDSRMSKSLDFSLNLFHRESDNESKNNCLLSPFSAYEALSMAANGAGGATRKAMAEALGVSDLKELNAHNRSVLAALNDNKSVQLAIANAIFADKNTEFKSSFISLCRNIYQAEARSEDFKDSGTVGKINQWCDTQTHGKIKKIIDDLKPRDKMVLLNSVYFKGAWDDPFRSEQTQQQDFHLSSGTTKQVPMMHKVFKPGYLKGQGFEAVRVAYAGKKQMMFVFLPDRNSDLNALKTQFTPANWKKWLPAFSLTKINLSMPKYKIEFRSDLSHTLQTIGMASAFSPGADFSEMFVGQHGEIGRVLQKTYMDVNEEGTEAAAVTAVMMAGRAMVLEAKPIDFVVDRPFIVAIVDGDSGEILFLGSIVDPQ